MDNHTPYQGTPVPPPPQTAENMGTPMVPPVVPPVEPYTPLLQNEPSGNRKNVSSFIGIVIIVFVLALGGFYLWGKRIAEEVDRSPQEDVTENSTAAPSAEETPAEEVLPPETPVVE